MPALVEAATYNNGSRYSSEADLGVMAEAVREQGEDDSSLAERTRTVVPHLSGFMTPHDGLQLELQRRGIGLGGLQLLLHAYRTTG